MWSCDHLSLIVSGTRGGGKGREGHSRGRDAEIVLLAIVWSGRRLASSGCTVSTGLRLMRGVISWPGTLD